MQLPIGFSEISLWLAAVAIILLITTTIISPYHSQTDILIDKGRLKKAALTVGILLILTILIRIFEIMVSH